MPPEAPYNEANKNFQNNPDIFEYKYFFNMITKNWKKKNKLLFIRYSKVKLATVIEDDPKAPFSIATTPRCRGMGVVWVFSLVISVDVHPSFTGIAL